MSQFVKELIKGLCKAMLAIAIVFGLFIGFVSYTESSATSKAENFCKTVVIGSAVSSLQARAISHGADSVHTKWNHLDGHDQLPATFSGATPLSRHICWIKATNGRVVSAKVVYLD